MSNEHEGSLTDYERWRGAGVIEKVMRADLHKRRRPSPVETALDAYAIGSIASDADMESHLGKRHKPAQARCALNGDFGGSLSHVTGEVYAEAAAAIALLDELGDRGGTAKQRQRDQLDRQIMRWLASDIARGEAPNYSAAEREFPLSRRQIRDRIEARALRTVAALRSEFPDMFPKAKSKRADFSMCLQ